MSKTDAQTELVPRLRFPEFREDGSWQPHTLSDAVQRVKKRIPVEDIALDEYVCTENLLPDFGGVGRASNLPPVTTVTQFKPGDALLANIRPYLKKAWFATRSGGASNDVFVFRSRGQVDPRFLAQRIQSDAFIAYVMSTAKGVKMPRGDLSHIEQFPLPLPQDTLEQRKIADCLGSLDDLIAAEGRKLTALRHHKKGLMQQLFPREAETQPRLRFPKFRGKSEWKQRRIGKILVKKAKAVTLDRDTLYREIGVRSHGKGLFHKDAVPGSTIGTKRVFHVVPDALVFNIVFAWERAVAVTTEAERGFIASHRFPMFIPRSKRCDVRFMQRLFLTPVGKELLHIASPGGAGRNRTLSQSDLSNLHAVIPDVSEQSRIADCLCSLDALIAAQAKRLDAVRTHKRGLMQQLFPSPENVQA